MPSVLAFATAYSLASQLTLTFSSELLASVVAASRFAVTVGGVPVAVTGVDVDGTHVVLTVDTPLAGVVLVSYTNPAQVLPPAAPSEANYVIPGGATVVTNQAQLETALAGGVAADIKLMNGAYSRATEYVPAAAHRLWGESVAGVVLNYGLRWNNMAAWEMHGMTINLPDAAHAAVDGGFTAAILAWLGPSANQKISDVIIDGASVVKQGIQLGGVAGTDIRRVKVTNVTDNGIRVSDNSAVSASVIAALTDIEVTGVKRAVRGASDGTAEAGVWVGHEVLNAARWKIRDCGWQGVAANNNCRDMTFYDLDIDGCYGVTPGTGEETGTFFYAERNTHNIVVERFNFGGDSGDGYFGFNGEWDDGTPGNAAMNGFEALHGRINTVRVVDAVTAAFRRGFYADDGSDDVSIHDTVFENSRWGCIGYYLTLNTSPADFYNNDYSQRSSGAVRGTTAHATDTSPSEVLADGAPPARLLTGADITDVASFSDEVVTLVSEARSSQQGPLPYLDFCGIEIANAARTVEYLRNGLGDTMQGHWELGDGALCPVLYRDGLTSGCTPTTFVSPASDPAPWHDPAEAGSDTFLGVLLLGIQGYDSTITRSVSQRLGGLGGGVFGSQNRQPRIWKFRGALVSSDDAGAEYGLRWLTGVLGAGSCDGCATCDLSVRLTCPPNDCFDDAQGKWTSYDAALIDGPHEVEQRAPGSPADTLAGCRDLVIVEWTIAAGNPFLYKQAVTCYDLDIEQQIVCDDICEFLFGNASGNAECCVVEPPQRGVLGAIFTLYSEDGFGSLLLEAYSECPGGSVGDIDPVLSMEISGVAAGTTVIIDSARHTILSIDANGVTENAESLVVLSGSVGIQWLEVRDCDDITCFCARPPVPCASGVVQVILETQIREG